MPLACRAALVCISAFVFNANTLAAVNPAPPTPPGPSKSVPPPNPPKPPKPSPNLSGSVSSTQNPQVAQYTIAAPPGAKWFVSFGPTTAYGRATSVQTISKPGPASMYVAGMLPETTYHMQASVTLADGSAIVDQDRTFTTGKLPSGLPYVLPVTLGAVGTPQPGIEFIDNVTGPGNLVATDLQGNIIWTYTIPNPNDGPTLYPGKPLPNGHILCFLSPTSYPVDEPGIDWLREFDLAGNTVRDLNLPQLNAGLSHIGFQHKLETLSHDFDLLPNGHTLLIANEVRSFTDLVGYPGTTNVVGDVVVDLDPSWKPVWFWDEFDHLDVNRHPMNFPDWTHTNSVAYSADDGNFIVSIRHQNWIVKVDYANGKGTGNIVWRLGEGGDFALQGGVDPTDWFYAQHDAEFEGSRSAGVFTLSVMDNGDDRIVPNGCGGNSQPPCHYSTIQMLQVDEKAKTATFQFHQILPTYLYSSWGGNVEVLDNGDIEYDLAGPIVGSQIFEVTDESTPQVVWQQSMPAANVYRGFRIPSLYPGVQW